MVQPISTGFESKGNLWIRETCVAGVPVIIFRDILRPECRSVTYPTLSDAGTYDQNEEFHDAMDAGKLIIDKAPTDIIQFDKLLHGRIDLMPINLYVGYGFIHSRYDAKTIIRFTHHPKPLKISRYHVLFSRAHEGNAALVETFNRGLDLLRETGVSRRLFLKTASLLKINI